MNNAMFNRTDAQLELGFVSGSLAARVEPRRGGRQIASWWFQRMREAVDRAVAWSPAGAVRPEQIWLPVTHRAPGLPVRHPRALEKEFCA